MTRFVAWLAICVVCAPVSLAGNPEHGDSRKQPEAPGSIVQRHADRLGLDPAARAAVEQIVREAGERDRTLRAQIDEAAQRVGALLDADSGAAAVMEQAERLSALETAARKSRIRALLEIRKHLVNKQVQELEKIRQEELAARRDEAQKLQLGNCGADLKVLCAQAAAGAERAHCLADRWEQLSESCRQAFGTPEPSAR